MEINFNEYAEGQEREEYVPVQFCPKCRVEMQMTHWPAVHAENGNWMGYFRAWVCARCGATKFEGKDEK